LTNAAKIARAKKFSAAALLQRANVADRGWVRRLDESGVIDRAFAVQEVK